mgnify:CR=1 FL=1
MMYEKFCRRQIQNMELDISIYPQQLDNAIYDDNVFCLLPNQAFFDL